MTGHVENLKQNSRICKWNSNAKSKSHNKIAHVTVTLSKILRKIIENYQLEILANSKAE